MALLFGILNLTFIILRLSNCALSGKTRAWKMRLAYLVHPIGGARESSRLQKKRSFGLNFEQ